MLGSIYGVFVGIDQYPKAIGPLHFCCDDAEELHKFFADNTAIENLRIFTLPAGGVRDSAKNLILQILEEFSSCSFAKDDAFIFFFAGHGLNADGQYYLVMDVPADVALPDDLPRIIECSLSLEKLRECVDRIKSVNQILIIDACRDEHTRSRSLFSSRIDDAAVVAFSALKERQIRPDGMFFRRRAIVSSCWQGQKSWEYDDGRHGWFTYHLLEYLRSQTAPIDLGFLVRAVEARMKEMIHLCPPAAKQEPHILLDGLILVPLRMRRRGPGVSIWYGIAAVIVVALALPVGTVWISQNPSAQTLINKPLPSPAARLHVDEWPKWEDRARQDAAVVTGTAQGVDFAHCQVALYTWSEGEWSLYLTATLDPNDGRWSSSLKLAPKYAGILASSTVQLKESLRQLPEAKDGIFYVAQSEQ